MAKAKPKKRVVYRSSRTGKFVSKRKAARHPATTEKQHVDDGARVPRHQRAVRAPKSPRR